ncbi:MAG: DNA primase [Saccharofermentanales bacterium]
MGHISQQSIDEVIARNDIVDVVSAYVNLEKRSAKNMFGLCPFHREDTPSFSVSPSKQMFYCFGCNKGGNVITFIQEIEHLEFPEAVRFLAERAGVSIDEDAGDDAAWKVRGEQRKNAYAALLEAARFYHTMLEHPDGRRARAYLKGRRVDRSAYRAFGLGYAPRSGQALRAALQKKGITDEAMVDAGLILPRRTGGYFDFFRHRIMFPIIDAHGRVLAFGGRSMDEDGPKYINTSETVVYQKGKHVFGMPQALRSGQTTWYLVEGYLDVMAMARAGIDAAVAPLGTALTEAQARAIRRRAEQVIIVMDSDRAGRDAALRAHDILFEVGVSASFVLLDGAKDPDDYEAAFGPERLSAALKDTLDVTEYRWALARSDAANRDGDAVAMYRDRVLDILAVESDVVKREMYARRLADELTISPATVIRETERRHLAMRDANEGSPADRVAPASPSRPNPKATHKKQRYVDRHADIALLAMLAEAPSLVDTTPSVPLMRIDQFSMPDDVRAFLTSETARGALTAEDFGGRFLKRVAERALASAKANTLTIANLHAIIDNVAETYDEGFEKQIDVVHSMIQRHYTAFTELEQPLEQRRLLFARKLMQARGACWRREAERLQRAAYELEMTGADEDAHTTYERSAMYMMAEQTYRQMAQGEE